MRRLGLAVLWLLPTTVLAETRALLAAGLGGDPAYETAFQRQADQAANALERVAGDVTLLVGDAVSAAELQRELGNLGARGAAGDTFVIELIGHGTYDERHYRFNVPGPDFTGEDLGRWLDALPEGRQLVVAATSASGALQPILASPTRTVITATRSGGERNVTVFAEYFAAALTDVAADTNKDGHVSAVEAFRFAEARVSAHYEERDRMATEHPVLSEGGSSVLLARLTETPAFDARDADERTRLAALEARIEALRADKPNRESNAYYAELQRLMLEMAMLRRQLDDGERAP